MSFGSRASSAQQATLRTRLPAAQVEMTGVPSECFDSRFSSLTPVAETSDPCDVLGAMAGAGRTPPLCVTMADSAVSCSFPPWPSLRISNRNSASHSGCCPPRSIVSVRFLCKPYVIVQYGFCLPMRTRLGRFLARNTMTMSVPRRRSCDVGDGGGGPWTMAAHSSKLRFPRGRICVLLLLLLLLLLREAN